MHKLSTSPRRCPTDNRPLRDRPAVSTLWEQEELFGARAAFGISVWFGLVIGLAELGLTLVWKHLRDPSPGFFRMNRHILWTIPLVNLVLFGLCGLLLALLARTQPSRIVRCSAGLLAGLALMTLILTYQGLHFWACVFLAGGLASCLARAIETKLAAFRRLVGRSIALLAIAVIGLVGLTLGRHVLREHWAMSALPATPTRGSQVPNVLLVVLDTVRADRMSLYGYRRDTTPNLARLARRGVTFTQAHSTAPWTLPSHASMMTGLWPHQQSARLHGPLDGTHTTLAQFLATHGYATAGFVANTTYCSAETGLARGFAHYEDHDLSPEGILCTSALGRRLIWPGLVGAGQWLGYDLRVEIRKDAARMNRDLLAWLKTTDKRPFFAFVNYLDAHSPYVPPASFDRHFGVTPESRDDLSILDRWFTLDKATLSRRDIQLASDAYDDCLAYLDEQLGRLFDELDQGGVLGNTLVIVTADHGEQFGEHDLYCHASSLYEQEIHVPLLVILPGAGHAGHTVAEPVSLRALPASVDAILDLDGIAPFPGQSLSRFWDRSGRPEPEPVLAQVDGPAKTAPNLGRSPAFAGPMKALLSGQDVYIRNGDGTEELYDLTTDPAQCSNLVRAPSVIPRLESCRMILNRMISDDRRPPEWRSTAGTRRHDGKVIIPDRPVR
jgi:arylsulfatase A-like enzyme